MTYFYLLIRDYNKWAVQFGDWNRRVVYREKQDEWKDVDPANWMIVNTPDDGSIDKINKIVELFNGLS